MKKIRPVPIEGNHKANRNASGTNRLLWIRIGGLLAFVAIWFFVLGILVGRQWLSFSELPLSKENDLILEIQEKGVNDTEKMNPEKMDFYEHLRQNETPDFEIPQSKISNEKGQSESMGGEKIGSNKNAKRVRYFIQVSAYRDLEATKRLVETLRIKGYKCSYEKFQTNGKSMIYRTRVGPYPSFQKANLALVKLKKEAYSGFVLQER